MAAPFASARRSQRATRARRRTPDFALHLNFVPQVPRSRADDPDSAQLKEQIAAECGQAALVAQTAEIVDLIRGRIEEMDEARARGEKYRIAVLGRTRTALAPIAQALRDAAIPFRAVDLEQLGERPEVLDALALARALHNGEDRVAWLGALRAPWCALSLEDLARARCPIVIKPACEGPSLPCWNERMLLPQLSARTTRSVAPG